MPRPRVTTYTDSTSIPESLREDLRSRLDEVAAARGFDTAGTTAGRAADLTIWFRHPGGDQRSVMDQIHGSLEEDSASAIFAVSQSSDGVLCEWLLGSYWLRGKGDKTHSATEDIIADFEAFLDFTFASDHEAFEFDVAMSFAGEDRYRVEPIVRMLEDAGIRVFYDSDRKAALWGKDLPEELHRVYAMNAFRIIMFISAAYKDKPFPTLEKRSASSTAIADPSVPYILPIRLDDTEIPGLPTSIAYIDGRVETPDQIVEHILDHLRQFGYGKSPDSPGSPERSTEPQKVSIASDAGRIDGVWAIHYDVTNASVYPISNAVVVVSDPNGETKPELQEATALEIVVGTVNPGATISGSSEVVFSEDPVFSDLARLATLLFVDRWGQTWAADGSKARRTPREPRIC